MLPVLVRKRLRGWRRMHAVSINYPPWSGEAENGRLLAEKPCKSLINLVKYERFRVAFRLAYLPLSRASSSVSIPSVRCRTTGLRNRGLQVRLLSGALGMTRVYVWRVGTYDPCHS